MEYHLINNHEGIVMPQQIPILLEAFQRLPPNSKPSSCPLCNELADRTESLEARAYYFHVSRHLQTISLEALPLSVEGLEIRKIGSESDEELSDSSTTTSSKNRKGKDPLDRNPTTPEILSKDAVFQEFIDNTDDQL
jgi:hypothetical protein